LFVRFNFINGTFLEQPEVEERLQRLEGDKDSLQMQVSILMDQIEVQTEKIADLEKNLSDRTSQLQRAEDVLQKEMLARSSAETAKLELLSEMSAMKLRSTALERENLELRAQLKRSEQDMVTLVSQVAKKVNGVVTHMPRHSN
jgi:chromosome segregation ATPase